MKKHDAAPLDHAARQKRVWFQYNLRTLLIITTLCAAGLAWWSYKATKQREAVAAIEAAGGSVCYDYQVAEVPGPPRSKIRPWLAKYMGPDYVGHAYYVSFGRDTTFNGVFTMDPATVRDDVLRRIAELRTLKYLDFRNAVIVDADLTQLGHLTELEMLHLNGTKVGDAGLEHLRELHALEMLDLRGTQVTDAGVEKLRQALPECTIVR